MADTLNTLGTKLIAQLYQIVTGGDQNVPPSKDTFLSWCMPGIPFMPEDFAFAAKGIGSGASADEDKLLIQQAFNFANFIDFIPDRTGVYNHDLQQTVFHTSEQRMSHIYGEILRFSKVVTEDLSDAEKAKIEKFRSLLRTTKKVKNLVTDEETEVTSDGPVLQAYNEKLADYTAAALEYNTKRVAAEAATGNDPASKTAVADWANNAKLYRLKVKAAADAWTSGGYRNEVDQMNAYINQVTQRDMMLWKQRLMEMFDDAHMSGLAPGQEFFFSSVIPGDFAASSGWTSFSANHSTMATSTHTETNSWSVGGGLNFGLFSVGGGASGRSSDFSSDYSVSSFGISFELAQVVISRPWFYPEFLINRGWMLRKGEGWNYDDMPSDGQVPPNGNFIAYPTTILFARNILIQSADFTSAYKAHSSSVGANVGVGWGPFFIGGSYEHGDSSSRFNSETDAQSIRVPGMQIIGFVNHLIGKAPNPLPEIDPGSFH